MDVTIRSGDAIETLMQAVLDTHRLRRNPGEFKTVVFDGGLSIVPERFDDANGRVINHLAPLDARVSFPEEERTISETLSWR